MASRMRSSPSSRTKSASKGQFFILTAVAIVTILFFVGRWLQPLAESDTSSIASQGELFTFDNIKEKASSVVKNSDNCNDLNYNIQEYKNFIDNFGKNKNYKITLKYSIPSCDSQSGSTVQFTLRILSDKADANGTFSVTWP